LLVAQIVESFSVLKGFDGKESYTIIGNLKSAIISWRDEKITGSCCGIRKADFWQRIFPSIWTQDLHRTTDKVAASLQY
jgi:hypothetical protein